ncbi:MAG: CCA tRNA nucleotidyltransferase [Lachnospiraceae bacterium]|nr:CCA tRNA nucleotidyltransferase [Lachnospiraceae bacterium]
MDNVTIRIPEDAAKIIEKLERAGYEAYVVGGCVRDSLLGREPGDWDITTSASPQEVKALFPRTIDTGILHGTVTVMENHVGYEVTTYRVDGEYEDGRHPKSVTFTRELSEDLLRRDFTINAMAYNPKTGVVDLYDGIGDLQRGCIRCVGVPEERFSEDALRILRALRFASQLDFEIEEKTFAAMKKLAPRLAQVSAERVRVELVKLLGGKRPEMLITAYETGVTDVILQEWNAMITTSQDNPHHLYDVGRHTIVTIQALHRDPAYQAADAHDRMVLDMAMLLHDAGKPKCLTVEEDGRQHFRGHPIASAEIAKEVLRRLKFDNDTTALVTLLARWHDCRFSIKADMDFSKAMRRIMNKVGSENMRYLFPIMRADIEGQHPDYRERGLAKVARMEAEYEEILRKKQCVSVRDLAVGGRELIAAGYRPGPALGDALERLLQIVLDDPEANDAQTLTAYATQWLAEETK